MSTTSPADTSGPNPAAVDVTPTQRVLADGTTVITAIVRLPHGWNKEQVTVEFVLPIPYPNAPPDCFYADADLRLSNGSIPSNSGEQLLDGQPRLWFSWHLSGWDPIRNNIHSYLRFVESRFRDAR